jgi:hypothetical protein
MHVHSTRSLRALATAAVSAVVLLAASPGAASAKIVLGKGAGGVSLGDAGAHVKSVLGKPRSTQKYTGGQSWFFSDYWVTLSSRLKVRGVEVKGGSEKTDKGIGVGTTYTRFRKAYGMAKCHADSLGRVYRICSFKTKAVNNRFVFSQNKKLALIDIGEVGEFA